MSGWQKLHRGLLSHWCAEDPNFLAVWVRLLLEANHSDNKSLINGKPRLVKRGQMVFGLHAFSARSGVSIGKLRRIINILLEEDMVSKQNFSKYSIITITNYEQYQSHDKHGASTEQAGDKQTTTLKECKEEKERKNNNPWDNFDLSSWPSIPSEQTLSDWFKMRKRIKADVSQTVINRLGKQLHAAQEKGLTVDECLSECILRNWRGFQADWIQVKNKNNRGFVC